MVEPIFSYMTQGQGLDVSMGDPQPMHVLSETRISIGIRLTRLADRQKLSVQWGCDLHEKTSHELLHQLGCYKESWYHAFFLVTLRAVARTARYPASDWESGITLENEH